MKQFIVNLWLWEEYCLQFTEKRIQKAKEKYYLLEKPKRVTSSVNKRLSEIHKMRKEWKTLREIWDRFCITAEAVRQQLLLKK